MPRRYERLLAADVELLDGPGVDKVRVSSARESISMAPMTTGFDR